MRTSLRLPPDLYDGIKAAAEAEQRSLNNLIERFLRDALARWQEERRAAEARRGPPGGRRF